RPGSAYRSRTSSNARSARIGSTAQAVRSSCHFRRSASLMGRFDRSAPVAPTCSFIAYNDLGPTTRPWSATMYSAFGLLKPNSDFTMTEATRRLAAKFPSFTVAQNGDAIVVSSTDWEIHLTL